jgi:hypothetical protein
MISEEVYGICLGKHVFNVYGVCVDGRFLSETAYVHLQGGGGDISDIMDDEVLSVVLDKAAAELAKEKK